MGGSHYVRRPKGVSVVFTLIMLRWKASGLRGTCSSWVFIPSSFCFRFPCIPKCTRTPIPTSCQRPECGGEWRYNLDEAPYIWPQGYHCQLCHQWFLFLFWNGEVGFPSRLPLVVFHVQCLLAKTGAACTWYSDFCEKSHWMLSPYQFPPFFPLGPESSSVFWSVQYWNALTYTQDVEPFCSII